MPQVDITEQLLREEENEVPFVYPDSLGFLTIGVGHLVDPKKNGRLPKVIIDALLQYDINEVRQQARLLAGYNALNAVQKAAVESMVFQLSIGGVRKFTDFLTALGRGDLKSAAAAGRDSLWDRQTHNRAEREMTMLESGLWVPKEMK